MYCLACRDLRVLENKRIYKVRHRDKVLADARVYRKTRYANDPEWAETQRQRIRDLIKTDPGHLSELRRRSYLKHADKRRAESITRRHAHRDEIYQRDGGRCHICGRHVSKDAFHIDHLIPVSKGGISSLENLALAHPACNMTRAAGRLPAQLLLIGRA